MNIAFAIVSIFAGGGLQRDCLAIASRLEKRGHKVTLFAQNRRGELPDQVAIELLPNRAWTNHGRDTRFADDVLRRCSGHFDRLVGFGKLKGLDLLYCADPCVAARAPAPFARLSGRRRAMIDLEMANFAPGAKTRCLLLSERQLCEFREAWATQPPVKGLDRAAEALKEFPDAQLLIAGIAADSRYGRSLKRWARHIGAADRVVLLGLRQDIPQLMAAADLLVHPARYDTTGTVILEALVNGLPVVTTDVCGYAAHVAAAAAGLVIPRPFPQRALVEALTQAQLGEHHARWSSNGIAYGERSDLYSG